MIRVLGRRLIRRGHVRAVKKNEFKQESFENFHEHVVKFQEVNKRMVPSSGLQTFDDRSKPDGLDNKINTSHRRVKWTQQSHPMKSQASVEARNVLIDEDTIEYEADHFQQKKKKQSKWKTYRGKNENIEKGVGRVRTALQLQQHVRKKQVRSLCENILWPGVTLRNRKSEVAVHLKKLRTQHHFRKKHNKVVLHGYKVILELARHQKVYPSLLISTVDYQRNQRKQDFVAKIEKELRKGGKDTFFVTASRKVMEEIDPGNDGFIAEYPMPIDAPKELLFASPRQFRNILVLDNITDGGMLGTFMRTSVIFGYDLVVFVNNCVDFYDPAVLVAAKGAHFQNVTRFVCLRDADGDDEFELLNQMCEHHRSQPFVYSPRIHTSSDMPLLSLTASQRLMIDNTIAKVRYMSEGIFPDVGDPGGIITNRVLHATRHTQFSKVSSAIFISDDKTEIFVPKLYQRLRIPPIRIMLKKHSVLGEAPVPLEFAAQDSIESLPTHEPVLQKNSVKLSKKSENHQPKYLHYQSVDVAAPIILYAMRSTELNELMTAKEREILDKVNETEQASTHRQKNNIVGDEDIREYYEKKARKTYEQRMERYKMTDEELFEQAEMKRIKKTHKNFKRFTAQKFDARTAAVMESKDPYDYTDKSADDDLTISKINRQSRYPDFFKEKAIISSSYTRENVRIDSAERKRAMQPSKYLSRHRS